MLPLPGPSCSTHQVLLLQLHPKVRDGKERNIPCHEQGTMEVLLLPLIITVGPLSEYDPHATDGYRKIQRI